MWICGIQLAGPDLCETLVIVPSQVLEGGPRKRFLLPETYVDPRDRRGRYGMGSNYTRRMDVLRAFRVRHSDMGCQEETDNTFGVSAAARHAARIKVTHGLDRLHVNMGAKGRAAAPLSPIRRTRYLASEATQLDDDRDSGRREQEPRQPNAIPGWKRSLHR